MERVCFFLLYLVCVCASARASMCACVRAATRGRLVLLNVDVVIDGIDLNTHLYFLP